MPKRKQDREDFYRKFGNYVSEECKDKKYYTRKNFPLLLQDVIMNYLMTMSEYRDIKFYKFFAFKYQDGAPMFTIGGIFDDSEELWNKEWDNKFISKTEEIKDINVPILTYCEKFHIDSNIKRLKQEIEKIEGEIGGNDPNLIKQEMTEKINKELPFELRSFDDLKSYVEYYRYYPQYYEGII